MKKLKQILSKDFFYYIQGNLRSWLFYSENFKGLIRPHIHEQIQLRICVMDTVCYKTGSCKLCGCKTTALQMANKACEKPCYPPMMNKAQWHTFESFTSIHKHDEYSKAVLFKKLALPVNAEYLDKTKDNYTRYKILLRLQKNG